MENNYQVKSVNEEIDLIQLIQVLMGGKWIILSITTIASILVVIYSLSLPNIYKSEALLSPVTLQKGLAGAVQNFSGLASLAGINLPSEGTDSNASKALEKVGSLSFFQEQILPNIFVPDLLAVESWSRGENVINYDNEIYDSETGSWTREIAAHQNPEPSVQESFRAFGEHIGINKDLKTGFIKLSVKHQSPFVAQAWAELIVSKINAFYKDKDREEAEASVSYLNTQISQTNYAEIREVISQLLQQQTQKLTLIEANDYYVFEYIDPPAVMERKAEPMRAMICIIGAILGGLLGCIIVLFRHYRPFASAE
jgi:uncharacterized protein involved in exopolysaccharide biosynthesis